MMGKTYTTEQVAKKIHRSKGYIEKLCQAGEIKTVNGIDYQYKIPEEELERLLDRIARRLPVTSTPTRLLKDANNEYVFNCKRTKNVDNYYSIKQVAEETGWSDNYISDCCLTGIIPGAKKFNSRWYIPKDTVDKCKEIRNSDGQLIDIATNVYTRTPSRIPFTTSDITPSTTSSATIQDHEIHIESVDAFDLYTQAYDALNLICKVLGGRTDKDMTAVYTDFDDIRKSLALHRSDIEAINDYTYTLVYLDDSPTPAAFPVRKQNNEGAVA